MPESLFPGTSWYYKVPHPPLHGSIQTIMHGREGTSTVRCEHCPQDARYAAIFDQGTVLMELFVCEDHAAEARLAVDLVEIRTFRQDTREQQ